MSQSSDSSHISKEILERLKELDMLPHFPAVLVRLERELATNSNVTIEEIVKLVAQDPSLTAGIISVVNSCKYSTGTVVSDIAEAIMRIGIKDVRALAHAINYKSSFHRKPPFSEAHFLKHGLVSAFIAQTLARHLKLNESEAFLAGLMHDMGAYLLAMENRDAYVAVIKHVDYDISKLIASEVQVFGTNHAIMGARLLQQWQFSQDIVMGVAFHHAPHKADDSIKPFAYLTALAEQGAFRLGIENGIADLSDEHQERPSSFLRNALDYFGISLPQYDAMINEGFELVSQLEMTN